MLYPSSSQRFEQRFQLQPWQLTQKRFDFVPAFVEFVRAYLQTAQKLEQLPTVGAAKMYINRWQYDNERADRVALLWEEYQTAQAAPPPPPQPFIPDPIFHPPTDSPTPTPTADHQAEKDRVREMLKAKGLISS